MFLIQLKRNSRIHTKCFFFSRMLKNSRIKTNYNTSNYRIFFVFVFWAKKIHVSNERNNQDTENSSNIGSRSSVNAVNHVRGCCLSPEDLAGTSSFVQGLATQVIVPTMERRILGLNATVTSVRKGMKNLVKWVIGWFGSISFGFIRFLSIRFG